MVGGVISARGNESRCENGVIVVTGNRADALARLDVFVGEWVVAARFPGGGGAVPAGRSTFEWALDRQFLIQRTEIPVPEAPDALMIVSADPETGAYTQHYYDSRGVVRLYAMSFADGGVDADAGVGRLLAPGFPAAFHRHVRRGREHHRRGLGVGPRRRRVGARLRPDVPQGRLR